MKNENVNKIGGDQGKISKANFFKTKFFFAMFVFVLILLSFTLHEVRLKVCHAGIKIFSSNFACFAINQPIPRDANRE